MKEIILKQEVILIEKQIIFDNTQFSIVTSRTDLTFRLKKNATNYLFLHFVNFVKVTFEKSFNKFW